MQQGSNREVSSMRKFMILGALVALVVSALALPALAQQNGLPFGDEDQEDYYENLWDGFEDRYGNSEDWEDFEDLYEDRFEEQGFFAFADERLFEDEDDRFADEGFFFGEDGFFGEEGFEDEGFFFGDDRFEDDDRFDPNGFGAGIYQGFDQEAESGDVNQSFEVSNTGDNSNQCANVQGVANTGNAQNQIGVLQYGSDADDFSFEDSGASIEVSPNSSTRCDQAVNQAATASGR
jgi:hypothetical protein